jgi:hypothetical protein
MLSPAFFFVLSKFDNKPFMMIQKNYATKNNFLYFKIASFLFGRLADWDAL